MRNLHIMKYLFFPFIALVIVSSVSLAQSNDQQKLEIYSKFKDKRCNGPNDMTIDKCNCPAAREMKIYIDALLDSGINKDDIFLKVAKKFSPQLIQDAQIKDRVTQALVNELGGKRSEIVFETPEMNFGRISKKEVNVIRKISLYNRGNADLVIMNVRVSCPCVTASLGTEERKSPFYGVVGAKPGWQGLISG